MFWKCPNTDISQSSWGPFSGFDYPCCEHFFLSNIWTGFPLSHIVSVASHPIMEKRLASSFLSPLMRQQKRAIGFQGNLLCVRLFPSASPSISHTPGPYPSWWPFSRYAPICQCHLYFREPKPGNTCSVWSHIVPNNGEQSPPSNYWLNSCQYSPVGSGISHHKSALLTHIELLVHQHHGFLPGCFSTGRL